VKDKLNSKCNDIPSKPIVDSLNKFVDVYKSLKETKISIAEEQLTLAVQMHSDNIPNKIWWLREKNEIASKYIKWSIS